MRKLLTIEEVAQILNLKTSTIYKYTCARKIPFVKLGNKVRFDESEIERWIGSKRVDMIK